MPHKLNINTYRTLWPVDAFPRFGCAFNDARIAFIHCSSPRS